MEVKRMGDIEHLGLRTLLYGDSGVGKTLMAGSIVMGDDERYSPAVFVDIDKGTASIAHLNDLIVIDAPKNEPIKTVQELETEFLKTPEKRIPELRDVKTVIIDSLSALRDDTLANIASREAKRGRRASAFEMQLQDYKEMGNILAQAITTFQGLGINLIVTAELNEEKDQYNRVLSGIPGLNPDIWKRIRHKMDAIWYVAASKDTHAVKVLKNDDDPYYAKLRNHAFAQALREITTEKGYFVIPQFDFPTIPYLYEMFYSNLEKDN